MTAPPATPSTVDSPGGHDLALLDALFVHAPVGLAFWDAELRYRRVNDALAAINGVPAEEHVGRMPSELLGALGEEIEALVRVVLQTGTPALDVEASGETPAAPGRIRHWRMSYYPVDDHAGSRRGVAAVVEDDTERREAEAERARLLREAVTARERAERMSAEAELARRRTEFLAAATARIAATLDFDSTLQESASVVVPALADWSALILVEPSGALRTAAIAHADPDRIELARAMSDRWPARLEGSSLIARAIRSGEVELVRAVGDAHLVAVAADAEHLAALRLLAPRSILVVPLRASGRVLGTLTLVRCDPERPFGEEDVALARNLAGRAALHLDNARLSTEQAHVARTLQASLLPRTLPEVPGVEIAARYLAAGAANAVGGDFYDVFANGDGTWTAMIGDVSGKGPEAAALTSLMRHTLRAAALRESSPATNLRLLNDVLFAEGDAARFCTALVLRLSHDPSGLVRVTASTGGHLPPFHLHGDGRLERLPVRGTLLGALKEPAFREVETVLTPHDVLVLHTDGVTELRGQEPEEGERRLSRVLCRHAGDSAEAIVDAVQRSAVAAQDGVPRDDIAVLALRAR